MTNQNDTQDEAEQKAWKVECSKAWFSKTPEEFHEYIFKQGYRAGVATKEAEIAEWKKRHSHLASGCDEMMTVQAALREENAKLKEWQQEDKDNDKLFCKWRDDLEHENSKLETENERLKESLSAVTVIQQRDAAIKQLAAEKQKALKLVEALKYYRGIVKGTWGYDGIIAAKYDNAISDYSTASGDGSGKMETNK